LRPGALAGAEQLLVPEIDVEAGALSPAGRYHHGVGTRAGVHCRARIAPWKSFAATESGREYPALLSRLPLKTVLPGRWVVERNFSWIDQNRTMSKDYERLPETGEAFVHVARTHLMLRRLASS
jgi:Transposase DDE domain